MLTCSAMCRFVAGFASRVLFHGDAKLPQLLRPAALHARCKPLRFTSRHLMETLAWKPRYSLEEALDRCLAEEAGRLSGA